MQHKIDLLKQIVSKRGLFSLVLLLFAISLAAQTNAGSGSQNASPQQAGTQTPEPGQLPPKEQPGVNAPGKTVQGEDRRAYGVLPNYRTAEMSAAGHPILSSRKLEIALKDSFDYPLFILAGAYAGLYQLVNTHPEFGQGAAGYFRRLGTSEADQVNGNMLTEGILPLVLHDDPRYFRLAEGPKKKRLWYALTRIVVTRTDAGKETLNVPEILGNGMAAGIGLSYYPDSRNVADYMQNWTTQLGTDATSQVLKEFWPDVKRWWYDRRHRAAQGGG